MEIRAQIGLMERLWVNLASVSQAHAPPPHLSNLCMKETLLATSYCSSSPVLKQHQHRHKRQDNIRSGINRTAVNGQRESIVDKVQL